MKSRIGLAMPTEMDTCGATTANNHQCKMGIIICRDRLVNEYMDKCERAHMCCMPVANHK